MSLVTRDPADQPKVDAAYARHESRLAELDIQTQQFREAFGPIRNSEDAARYRAEWAVLNRQQLEVMERSEQQFTADVEGIEFITDASYTLVK